MLSTTTGVQSRLAALARADWAGYRHALSRTFYALLLVLVLLLPANFVAYALCATIYRGGALAGALYASSHHLTGYWMGSDSGATAVGAVMWWMAAVWEALFWASCGAALVIFVLWMVRGLATRTRARSAHISRGPSRTIRAA